MGTHTFVSFQFRGILKKSTTNTSMIFLFSTQHLHSIVMNLFSGISLFIQVLSSVSV